MDNDSSTSADAEIVEQIVAGDVHAFEHLLRKYQNHVLILLKKHLPYDHIEETAQDVFIRAYRSLPTFRGESSFKQWLSTIAVRACYDFWRKHYKSRELPMSSLTEKQQVWLEEAISAQASQSFHEQSLRKEARVILDWALDRLSAADRMVLELVYLEGYSLRETADLLGWSIAHVKVRSFRARKKLHKVLSKQYHEEGGTP